MAHDMDGVAYNIGGALLSVGALGPGLSMTTSRANCEG